MLSPEYDGKMAKAGLLPHQQKGNGMKTLSELKESVSYSGAVNITGEEASQAVADYLATGEVKITQSKLTGVVSLYEVE